MMKPDDSLLAGREGDANQRRRAVEETDRSFVVEASAGTGKTSTLIGRILHLVLVKGPQGVPVPLSRICAITFTEKAAGEMKLRLRQDFEEVLAGKKGHGYPLAEADLSGGVRFGQGVPSAFDVAERARQALIDLETASISTFHSLAVSLLKERPVEAGLDPRFTALDEIQSELFFREVWDSWISLALEERRPVLERALRAGLRLDQLEELARILRLNARAARLLQCPSPPTEEEMRRCTGELLEQGGRLRGQIVNPGDRLFAHLERALRWLENPGDANSRPSRPGNCGSSANWSGGRKTVLEAQSFVRQVAEFCEFRKKWPFQRLLNDLIRWMMDGFLPEWEGRKRARGLLDFDDQLWMARELLRRSAAARREFQTRYATLLVDEFQDTDPVQWDIVRMLSSSYHGFSDPGRCRPGPGRLFIVGDPKQSIYRFRGADIETYLAIVERKNCESLGLERLQLTTNFRSAPSILRFADAAFEETMRAAEDGLYQPDYLPFGDHGHRKVEARSPAVSLLGDRNAGGGAATVREFLALEASRIARLILRIHGSEAWKVQDRGGKESPWRAPRYGDIAILLPVLSRADILEDALRDHDIPYVLEGGKFYYARSEVSSAITVLRAVANPNDSVALYGALRSIFFGLSDEDLLRARIENQPFDYREEAPPESPLCRPFQILRDLHWHRHERRASESLELLLQKTGAREVLAPRGFQSLANLNKLARTLRALQGEYTFTQAVELVSAMDEEGLAESESRIMEERSDAVRVMSIHKAKGLDFPIVFVASLGMKRKSRGRNFLADFHVQKVFGLRVGPKDSGFETPGWDKLSEWENNRENAELVRLLYVALTRARDHLILSTHTKDWRENGPAGRPVPDMQGTRLTPLSSFLEKCRSEDTGLVQWIDVDALDAAPAPPKEALPPPERDWRAALERDCSQLAAIMDRALGEAGAPGGVKAAVAGAADEELAPEERSPDSAEGRAIRLGVAFHEAMERVDLAQEAGPVEFLSSLGVRHRLDAEGALQLEDMVRTALSSELLGRVRAAVRLGKRAIRELPFVRPEGPSDHKEGKMDLLFEEEGAWVLVDYKTDRIPQDVRNAAEFFREKYASQIGDYVQALRLLSVPVQSAYLLLARTGESIRMI